MTTYSCPVHRGEFSDDDLPAFVRGAYCPECLKQEGVAMAKAQQDFDAAYRAWHSWLHDSGVPTRGRNRTLANWIPQERTQQAASKLLHQFADGIATKVRAGQGVTLLGPPGVGKTHIGYALIAAAYGACVHARYVVWGDVLDRTKASFATRAPDDRKLLDVLKRVPLLVLDEVGVRVGTEFDQSTLFDLIDTRYRDQRSTVVISNLTADALRGEIGERTADRLREANHTITLRGDSQRAAAGANDMLLDAAPALLEPTPPLATIAVCVNGRMVERPLAIRKPEVWA